MNIAPQGRTRAPWRLATILAFAFVALSALSLLLSSSLQIYSNVRTLQSAITSNQQLIARDAASTVQSFVARQFAALEMSVRVSDSTASSEQSWRRVLQGLLGVDPSFRHLVVLGRDDRLLASASRVSSVVAEEFIDQLTPAYIAEIKQRERFVGQVFIDTLTNEPQIVIAIPITNVIDERYGTLIADVNLKFMWDLVQQLQVGEGGYAYVVDRQGRLLAFNDTARVFKGERVDDVDVVGDFINSPTAAPAVEIRSYTGITGRTVVGSYVPLGNPDWAVVTEIPWEEAYQDVINDALGAAGVLAGTVGLAVVIGAVAAFRLTSPLVNLMHTATRIADGDNQLQAVVAGPREIANLAVAFNRMTAQLRSIHDALEQRIAQRTQDLQLALADVEARAAEQERLIDENSRQRAAIRELSVPILPLTRRTLVMPLIGILDSERLDDIQRRALEAVERTAAQRLLLDITGVPVVDTQVAQGLLATAQMVRLLGADVTLIGIRPEVAQTIVGLGLDLSALSTSADLQTAFATLLR